MDLFLILSNGQIVYSPLSRIIAKLVNEYPNFENLIRVSFQRNDYLNNRQAEIFFGIGEMKKSLPGEAGQQDLSKNAIKRYDWTKAVSVRFFTRIGAKQVRSALRKDLKCVICRLSSVVVVVICTY